MAGRPELQRKGEGHFPTYTVNKQAWGEGGCGDAPQQVWSGEGL
jgi:hypothetical protein